MIYQRKIITKGHIYYILISCKEDSKDNFSQKYLETDPLTEKDFKECVDIEKDLKPHEKLLTMIFHSIHKNKDSLVEYEIIIRKAANNGIKKNLVDDYLELFIDKKVKLNYITSKVFETNLSKDLLDSIDVISRKTGFPRPTLEKVTRIYYIFNALNNTKLFKENFAIFGGTAINGIYKNWPRMSVDLDLQYIGIQKKEDMEEIRKEIQRILFKVLINLKYKPEIMKITGGVSKYKAVYIMKNGHKEHIKFDINLLNRIPILPLITKEFISPLDRNNKFLVNTFQREELYAKKFIALSEREASRDVYDISNLKDIEPTKFRKTLICAYLLYQIEIENLLKLNMKKFNVSDFSKELIPTLKKLNEINPKQLLSDTQKIVEKIQKSISKNDLEFVNKFNKSKPNFKKLFETVEFNMEINKSPLLETVKKI